MFTSFVSKVCKGPMSAIALSALFALVPGSGLYAATTPTTGVSTVAYSALINKFTNSYWLNGSWRASAGVSVAATQQNMAAFKVGTAVRTADGQIRTVTALKPASGALTVFMNGPVLNGNLVGYPNRLRISAVASTLPLPSEASPAPVSAPNHAALINKFNNSYWLNGSWRGRLSRCDGTEQGRLHSWRIGTHGRRPSAHHHLGEARQRRAVCVHGWPCA